MTVNETIERLTDRFGPIDQPVEWHGINEHGIDEALVPLPHIINRGGLFADISHGSAAQVATAYVVARLTRGRPDVALGHWAFGADSTYFGIVTTVGEIALAEKLIGKSFEDGRSKTERRILKANFVSPSGLLATIRQAVRGVRGDFIVNRGGLAEVAVQEMLPEAQEIVISCLAGTLSRRQAG